MRKLIYLPIMVALIGLIWAAPPKKDKDVPDTVQNTTSTSQTAQATTQTATQTQTKKRNQTMTRKRTQMKFVDENGDGINDLMMDDDGDGIPNGKDPDWNCPNCQKEQHQERIHAEMRHHEKHQQMSNGECPYSGGSQMDQEKYRENDHSKHQDHHNENDKRHDNNRRGSHHDNNDSRGDHDHHG